MEDGSAERIAVSWNTGSLSHCHGAMAALQRNDNGDNVNSFMAVQRERATRGHCSAVAWQFIVAATCWVGGAGIVFACKLGKQWWQQHCSTVY